MDSKPTANVTINLSSSANTAEGTVFLLLQLHLYTTNWGAAQLVTVTGVNADVDDNDCNIYNYITSAASSAMLSIMECVVCRCFCDKY
jgi:hypothetical protein